MKRITFILACVLLYSLAFAQRGKDGAKTVSTANNIVNEYTALTANAVAGSTTLTVANSGLNANNRFAAPLAPGDLVMIIQMQGASLLGTLTGNIASPLDSTWGTITSYNNCGNNEFAEVLAVPNGTTITLRCGLEKDYTAAGKAQVVRVPRYTTLTINSPGVITCDTWNGATGGVCAIEVQGNTVINAGGSISATGKGFRGGMLLENNTGYGVDNIGSILDTYGAEKGEGVGGFQADYDPIGGRYGKGAPGNGGGGGNAHNGGGGGGANGGDPNAWNGHGNPDLSVAGYAAAWNLEYSWKSSTTSSGGGKGGYTFSSSNQNATTTGPTVYSSSLSTGWGGDYRRNHGGFGGRPLDYSTGRLFLGGGGGAGDQNDGIGGAGGNGGGLIYLMSYGTVSGSGQVVSNGNNGNIATGPAPITGWGGKDAAGGGGAGGTIIINSTGTVSGITATANGGNGGNQVLTAGSFYFGSINEAEGPGAGGGGGYIAVSNGSITQTANGGNNGTTNSDALTEFAPNGATKGGAGSVNQTITNFTITSNNATVCAGNSATLTATLSGTVPAGITVQWYAAATGSTVIGTGTTFTTPALTSTTTYYVGTCPGTYTIPVTVTVTPGLTTTASSDTTVCAAASVQLSVNAPGATSYSWSPAVSLNNPAIANPIASPVSTTTYTVTVSDGTGCLGVDSVTVTVSPLVGVSAGNDVAVCSGSSTTLNATGGTNYSWSPSAGLSNPLIANPAATPASTTTYTVTVTNAAGCSATDDVTIIVNALPAADAGSNTSVCSGASATLAASGGNAYAWIPAATLSNAAAANPVATPAVTTTYTVNVTDVNGCSNTDSVTVTVNPLPAADAGPNASVCTGGSVTLNATGGTSYAWSPAATLSNPNIANPVASPASTTTYTVTVTDANGCTATDTVTVSISTSMTVSAGPDLNICDGSSIQLSVNATGTYNWQPAASLNNNAIASPLASPASTTTYTVTVTDANGCQGSDTITVSVASPVVLTVSNDVTICAGQTATLNATANGGDGGPYTYTWNNNLAGNGPHTVSPATTTTYNVYATDGIGCISLTDSITVTVNPPLAVTATAAPYTVCAGNSSVLTASVSGGDGNYNYSWQPVSPTVPSATVTPVSTTTYTVTVTDACGSPAVTDTVTVTVVPAAVVTATASTLNGCEPVCVDFTSQSTGNCTQSAWDLGDGNTVSGSNINHCYSAAGSYNVVVTCTDGNGCSAMSSPLTINVFTSPVADFTESASTVILDPSSPAEVCFTDNSSGADSWSWNFADNTGSSSLQSPCYTYSDTGTYCVSLTVTNAGGCTDSISHCIKIIEVSEYSIPNVFTPNGDGRNDLFTVKAQGVKNVSCMIFNRWGTKVYEWSSIAGGWDGHTTSGQMAEDGVYYYTAVITAMDGTVKEEKGFLQLINK